MAKIIIQNESITDIPSPGKSAIFVDPSTKTLKSIDDEGTVTDYTQGGGGGGGGSQGVTGARGATGLAGANGSVGPQGATGVGGGGGGSQGATGVSGSAGPQGATGVSVGGTQGVTGLVGPAGPQGATGVGTAGSAGSQGATGVGLQGATGPSGAPQGATGVAGANGAQGATGVGSNGAQGATGVGSNGSNGPQGATGVGAQGVTGLAGSQGATGPSGGGGGSSGFVYKQYTPASGVRVQLVANGTTSDINNINVAWATNTVTFTGISGTAQLVRATISYDASINTTTSFILVYPEINGQTTLLTTNFPKVIPYTNTGALGTFSALTITNSGGTVTATKTGLTANNAAWFSVSF